MDFLKFPDEVLSQHVAILGKTGSGKTSTEKLAVEQVVAADFRVCILDSIKSDWWGVTSSAGGDQPGLPFKILGGPHGHVPLHSSAGAVIGQLVGSGKLPLSIIDMADFEAGGLQRFFVDFAPALMKAMRGVLYLVIEEAHEFAPKERAGFGAESMAIHWAKKLATAGRSKGIRLIVATQRVQSLHNALLGSCETVIAHRLTTPADQEPILKWLKANADKATTDEVSRSLSSLPTGTGWLCSGEAQLFEKVKFPKFKTYDNAATPEKDGAEVVVRTAAVDQNELRAIIGEAVKVAEANDPALLRSRIQELEQAGGVATPAPADPAALQDAETRGYQRGLVDGMKRGADEHKEQVRLFLERSSVAIPNAANVEPPRVEHVGPATPLAHVVELPAATPAPPPRVASAAPGDPELAKGERVVLRALAQLKQSCTRDQLSVLTGYKNSTRNEYIKRLAAKGYAVVEGATIKATEAGVAALGDFEPLPTGAALRAFWVAELPEGESRILAELCKEYPRSVSREILSERTDYKSSTRNEYIKRLKARQLVADAMAGSVVASANLF